MVYHGFDKLFQLRSYWKNPFGLAALAQTLGLTHPIERKLKWTENVLIKTLKRIHKKRNLWSLICPESSGFVWVLFWILNLIEKIPSAKNYRVTIFCFYELFLWKKLLKYFCLSKCLPMFEIRKESQLLTKVDVLFTFWHSGITPEN